MFGVLTLAILAHALGPASLGILVMVEAYAKLVDQLVRLETWQCIVRYGSAANEEHDFKRLKRLLKFGTLVDCVGALSAAAVAFACVPIAADLFGWDAETMRLAQIGSISLLLRASSTPTGVLQLYGRFPVIAWSESATAMFRLVATAATWAADGPLLAYFLIMILLPCLQRIGISLFAWRELRRRGHQHFIWTPLNGVARENSGLWSLLWSANATVLVRKSTQELDSLIVGSILGSAAVGIYHIARRLGQALTKLGSMLQQASFPDLARIWARADTAAFLRLIKQVELATLGVGLLGLVIGAWNAALIVSLIAGPEFKDAVTPLIIQMCAVFLFLCGSTLRPALMSMGLQVQMLGAVLASAIVFYIVLLLAVPRLGVAGASLAHVAFNLILLPASALIFARGLRRESSAPRADPASGPASLPRSPPGFD